MGGLRTNIIILFFLVLTPVALAVDLNSTEPAVYLNSPKGAYVNRQNIWAGVQTFDSIVVSHLIGNVTTNSTANDSLRWDTHIYSPLISQWTNDRGYVTSITNDSYVPYTGATSNVNLGGNNLTTSGMNATGLVWIKDTLGATTNVNNLIHHLEELSSDTLLDRSRSTLSCANGKLNYTLYATDGSGDWNFNGIVYAGPGVSVANANVTLICGTDINPKLNYVFWNLSGSDVPTMVVSNIYPTENHIDTATFYIGACSGTSYTVYSYSRNRYEVDKFITRVIQRFEESGTLYVNGLLPVVNSTDLNVSTTGSFFNGIFEMTSTNLVSNKQGFYYINSTGQFVQATSLSAIDQYSDGTAFAGNNRMNVIWGVVPINTTGGTGPTQLRLVAVPQAYPGSGKEYISAVTAEQDQYDVTLYYPSNAEVKAVFTPIARTIIRASTPTFEMFQTGTYFRDIRGKITSGGGAPAAISSNPTFNSLFINNVDGTYNAISAQGNLDNYFQFNIKNLNTGTSASSDVVATSSYGTETSFYVDLGINGPRYNDAAYAATKANDSYLLAQNSSLIIGTGSASKVISFFTTSFSVPEWLMNMSTSGIQIFKELNVSGNVNAPNLLTSNNQSVLTTFNSNITNMSYRNVNNYTGIFTPTMFNVTNSSYRTVDNYTGILTPAVAAATYEPIRTSGGGFYMRRTTNGVSISGF